MVPVYKVGGPHKFEGVDFSFKGVSLSDLPKYLRDGWVKSKDELHIIEVKVNGELVDTHEDTILEPYVFIDIEYHKTN